MAGPLGKRKAASVPAQSVTAWDALADLIANVAGPRPRDSVTAQELSKRTGLSRVHCANTLRERAEAGKLRAVEYRTGEGRRGKCYVAG